VTDAGELRSLQQMGVQSIDLQYTEQSFIDVYGNNHALRGSYTTVDGVNFDVVDIWFRQS